MSWFFLNLKWDYLKTGYPVYDHLNVENKVMKHRMEWTEVPNLSLSANPPNFHSKTFQHSGLSTLRVCSTRWKRRSLAKSWARCSTCGLKTSWCWAKSQSPAFPNHWPPSYPEFSNHVPSNWRDFCDRSDALDPHTDSRVLQGTSGVPDGCGGTHWRITLGTKCKKGTTPLGFICCCVCSLHATIPFRFMCWRTSCKKGYNTFRVYMLLDLVQEGQRQLYGLCIALNPLGSFLAANPVSYGWCCSLTSSAAS